MRVPASMYCSHTRRPRRTWRAAPTHWLAPEPRVALPRVRAARRGCGAKVQKTGEDRYLEK